ncbi:MAG: hypothetical protein ACFFA4_15460 [Promethearchaeota archaeon]
MAQATTNKDVRKNCVDVEQVIKDCLIEANKDFYIMQREPVNAGKLYREFSKSKIRNNANYNSELVHIDRIKQNLVYKNYSVYNI